MAEIKQQASSSEPGRRRRAKKMSTKVDMTPMVDLAFLLLTFFMLTTTFARPYVLKLTMPAKGAETAVPESRTLTIVLGRNHRVHYFFGLNAPLDKSVRRPELRTTNFAANGIRQVLLRHGQTVPGAVVLIKPGAESKYQDLVNILDEMTITDQKKYALVDITPADNQLISNF